MSKESKERKKFRRFLLELLSRADPKPVGPSGWPVFTIRDHGLKGKTYGHNGHGLGATASYFTMPHERAACVCVCVFVKASPEDSRSLRSAHRSRRRRMSFAMPLTTSAIATLVNARRANPSITILLFHVRERYRVSLSGSLKTREGTHQGYTFQRVNLF